MDGLGTDLRIQELGESGLGVWWHDVGFGRGLEWSALGELLCSPSRILAECVQESKTGAG